jgi:gas vesicle protein
MFMKKVLTNGSHSLIPLLAGGIVGAGLSFLLAPKSGVEVRKDIKRFANDSKEKVSLAIDRGKGLYNDSVGKVSLAIDKSKGLYQDSVGRVSLAIDRGREFYDGSRAVVGKAIEAGKTAYIREKEKWQHT